MILSTLDSAFRRQMFNPGFLGLFVNPFYFARKELHRHITALSPNIKGKTLDVGCGIKPYKEYCHSTEYIGLEMDSPGSRKHKQGDYYYDGKIFPFANEEFDSVITSQVLEHVFNPDEFLSQIARVLKPKGVLLLTVPFVWDEHEQPFDFGRYSSFGLRHLLEKHSFDIIEYRKSLNDIRIIFQLLNDYLYKKTITNNQWLNYVLTFVLMSPFNILGELLALVLPKNDDLFLDSIVLARRK